MIFTWSCFIIFMVTSFTWYADDVFHLISNFHIQRSKFVEKSEKVGGNFENSWNLRCSCGLAFSNWFEKTKKTRLNNVFKLALKNLYSCLSFSDIYTLWPEVSSPLGSLVSRRGQHTTDWLCKLWIGLGLMQGKSLWAFFSNIVLDNLDVIFHFGPSFHFVV